MVVAHSGDQGEIVGRLPPVTALGLPPALGAMGDGYRLGGWPFLHGSAQTASRASGVRRDVGQTPAMLETVAGDDGEELRGYSLQHCQPLRVGGHLEQRRHLEAALLQMATYAQRLT